MTTKLGFVYDLFGNQSIACKSEIKTSYEINKQINQLKDAKTMSKRLSNLGNMVKDLNTYSYNASGLIVSRESKISSRNQKINWN